jgi:hypothetical protein
VNGGFQGRVKSPMNKGRDYTIPGIGLAGDWPGAWTQTYAQVDSEAGPHGFDQNYFVQQVAGLTQLAGDLMRVPPLVIDLGWGALKSALVGVADASFTDPADAAAERQALLNHYVAAFRHVEAGALDEARRTLKDLTAAISTRLAADRRAALTPLIDRQLAKL